MEPVAETDLRCYLAKDHWEPDELITLRSFVGCLSSAVLYLHQQEYRHKDLKPPNILIKGDTVLIADFGLALDWSDLSRETTVGRPEAYTESYIAPEVDISYHISSKTNAGCLGWGRQTQELLIRHMVTRLYLP
jgi:serine/threonine protein kinase